MSQFNFNAAQEEPDAGRMGPVPAGWYVLIAKKLEHALTSGGDGEKINAQFEIVEGIHKGNMVFHNFNMRNASEKAEKIGRGQFSALCHAIRQLQIQNLTQMYSIPFKAKLKITKDETGQYEPKNEITAFKDVSDPAAVDVGGAPAATTGPKVIVAPQPTGGSPVPAVGQPWANQAPAQAAPAQQAQPAAAPVQQLAPQPWAQPAAAAPVQQQAAPAAAFQPTPEQMAAWMAQQQAAAQPAPVQQTAQPAWATQPAIDPNAVAASQAAPGQGQTAAPSQGPAVAQQTPPWMQQPAA